MGNLKLSADEQKQFNSWVNRVATATDDVLAEALPRSGTRLPEDRLWECMRYSVFSGGKRLRPALIHGAYALCGGKKAGSAAHAAAAMEMIHVYSLIQDDLPCMDNDDIRHGVATAHKKFDEATALMASDGLQASAFEVLAGKELHEDADVRCELVKLYANAMGALGMVAGQMVDMEWEWKKTEVTRADLARLSHLKTGALIHASVLGGAALAGADAGLRRALTAYASGLGLAYQIHNDVLDAEGETEVTGKQKGKDASAGKRTFVTILGLEAAKKQALAEAQAALDALEEFGEEADPLRWLVRYGVTREK
jgi:farnesyl diphosphate synthase